MTSATKPRVPKPRGFIHWTNKHGYHNKVGVLNIGRVSIPGYMFIVAYAATTVIWLLSGGIIMSVEDTGNIAPLAVPLLLLAFAAGVGVVIGLYYLVVVIASEIKYASEHRDVRDPYGDDDE